MFKNMGLEIPTYVRSDNSDAVHRVDSVSAVTNAKRSDGFLESNMGELVRNDWLSVGYIPGDMNTPGGITKSMYIANMRNLLAGDTLRIVAEAEKKEIRRKIPESKRYIVYDDAIQGKRIWTLTCDERLARCEVRIAKWCWDVRHPLIRIN